MTRFLSKLIAAALVVGGGYYGLSSAVEAGLPRDDVVVFSAALAVIMSACALFAGLWAWRRIRMMNAQLVRVAKSIEFSLAEFQSRSTRDSATISEMNRMVARELETISGNLLWRRQSEGTEEPGEEGSNIVALPAPRRHRPQLTETPPREEPDAMERVLRDAVAAGEPELSLQPIVSVSRGIAAGFEVFAHLPSPSGNSVDLRRLPETIGLSDRAAFERVLFFATVEASRRRLGAVGETMPLHVSASGALLGETPALSAILDLLSTYPDITKSLVISLPAAIATPDGGNLAPLTLLTERGMRIAIEGWNDTAIAPEPSGRSYATFVKLTADRLLDREKARRNRVPGTTLIEAAAAAGLTVIATDVRNDEDAVSLIDLGIDLMSGERFSGPKLLKPEASRNPGKAAVQ